MDNGFLNLLQSFDALFPIGSYTLSNGMETYVQKELICDGKMLERFLKAYLYALPYNDLGFAAQAATGAPIEYLDMLCGASKAPAEVRTGSQKLCARFLKAEVCLGHYPKIEDYSLKIAAGSCSGFHCIAVGLLIADLDAALEQGLEMYCYNLLTTIVNHAVKLVPLGQLAGQQALSAVLPLISEACHHAMSVSDNELGFSGAGFDLRAMQHETLYSRLYQS